MASAAHAHEPRPPARGPPSSRVDARLLGMYFFIASEAMLFGSFFSTYFFARVVVGRRGRLAAGGRTSSPSTSRC